MDGEGVVAGMLDTPDEEQVWYEAGFVADQATVQLFDPGTGNAINPVLSASNLEQLADAIRTFEEANRGQTV